MSPAKCVNFAASALPAGFRCICYAARNNAVLQLVVVHAAKKKERIRGSSKCVQASYKTAEGAVAALIFFVQMRYM